MNKIFRFLLMGALVCGLSLSVTSCKDDDEEKVDERIVTEDGKTYVPDSLLTDHERYQLACQFAVIGTMRNLAGLENVTPDVINTTYEPTYGMTLDGEGATVRVVKCESTEEAEQSFRAIAGLDSTDAVRMYTPTPDGYVLSLKDLPILENGKTFSLGTLTFHRDGGPRRYGWVEVDIPCIPHLERIDYLSPDAFPDNAGTNSAYQLGDIVYVSRGSGYSSGYYLCIQPYAYNDGWLVHLCINEPGDDQTINADGDSEGCYYPYNKDKGQSTTYDMINTYCNFICNNQGKVANIKKFLNGEALNLKPTVSGCLHHIFPEGFNNDKGVPFVMWDGRDAAIWYDGYVTKEYAWVPAYYYREARFCWVSKNVRYWKDGSYKYVKDSEWNSMWNTKWNYCMNAIRFTTETINGATIDYSPLNDPLYTKDTPPSDYTYYQFDVPSFEGAKWNSTLIKDVYVEDQWIAQVCQEYVPKINRKERITVVYPVYYGLPRYDKGFFPGDNSHKPAYVSWTDNGETVKTCEELSVGQVSSLYASADMVVTELPETEWAYEATDIKDEYLQGKRIDPLIDADRDSNYPLVKIFNRVWTRECYKHYVGTHVSKEYTVEMDGKPVAVRNVCYYPDVAANGSNWPAGWQVASWNDDYKPMLDKLAANNFSKPALELFNGHVTGFEFCFEGWNLRYGYTWYNDTQMHGTRDGVSFWVRTDGTYTTESWNDNPNREPVRLVKKQ